MSINPPPFLALALAQSADRYILSARVAFDPEKVMAPDTGRALTLVPQPEEFFPRRPEIRHEGPVSGLTAIVSLLPQPGHNITVDGPDTSRNQFFLAGPFVGRNEELGNTGQR
jgi:hypothetical protein